MADSRNIRPVASYQSENMAEPVPDLPSDAAEKERSSSEDVSDGGEKAGANGGPQFAGFWDARLAHVRKEVFSKWCLTTVVLMMFILGVLSLYWGSLYRVEQHLSALQVFIVDFDGQPPYNHHQPVVGPEIVALAESMATNYGELGYIHVPASHFSNDPMNVRQAVYDFEAWAAIVINPNATSMLYSALNTGNASYDPLGACQLIFTDSRDDTNWYDFIYPLLSSLMTEATSTVGEKWTGIALKQAEKTPSLLRNLAKSPQSLSPAIGFSMYNLRPFYPYQTIPAVSVGLIYLIILSFFSFSFYLPIHMKLAKPGADPNHPHPPLKPQHLIFYRWCATMVAYFFLSLAYSLISLAFQINFSGGAVPDSQTLPTQIIYGNPDGYGMGTFPVYWMLNFWGMIALGLACENVAMIAGMPWTGLWLIFWVITNVCTSFYDIDLEPTFYHWGYAFPLHNIVEGSRSILFDLHSRLGLNFGILVAWGAVNTALFPLCCYYLKWKTQKGIKEYWA